MAFRKKEFTKKTKSLKFCLKIIKALDINR